MKASQWLALTTLVSGLALAQDINIQGDFQQKIQVLPHDTSILTQQTGDKINTVTLMHVSLGSKALQTVQRKLAQQPSMKALSLTSLPPSVQLGMENVPVLNQGIHGSCVVFAVTAAMDAVIKKGDYVSQLCALQLGQYLQNYGYGSSGWEGGLGAHVLGQFDMFGLMSKDDQRAFGCGGLTEYPVTSEEIGQEMSLSEYHEHSQSVVSKRIAWTSLLDLHQSIHDRVDGAITLSQVKQVLARGDRLVMAILLADYEKGLAGAIGTHKAFNDTWLLTPEIINDINENPQFAGHEMIITGYDDNAYAKDDFGRIHRGLITLRNSWGDKIGDQGTFYMSYDYFRSLVMETQRIRQFGFE